MRCSLELKLRGGRNASGVSEKPQRKQPSPAQQCRREMCAWQPQQRPHLLRRQHVPQPLMQRRLAGCFHE
jgi:hypothetical protein